MSQAWTTACSVARSELLLSALAAASPKILHLTLRDVPYHSISTVLRRLPGLCSVQIEGARSFGPASDFFHTLAPLGHLQSLDLDTRAGLDGYSYVHVCHTPWLGFEWKSARKLKALRLRSRVGGSDGLAFVELFATSLVSLYMDFGGGFATDATPTFSFSFPSLASLGVKIPIRCAKSILSSLSKSPLQHLHVSIGQWRADARLGAIVRSHAPALITFALSRYAGDDDPNISASVKLSSHVAAACAETGVSLSREGVFDPFRSGQRREELDQANLLQTASRAVDMALGGDSASQRGRKSTATTRGWRSCSSCSRGSIPGMSSSGSRNRTANLRFEITGPYTYAVKSKAGNEKRTTELVNFCRSAVPSLPSHKCAHLTLAPIRCRQSR